MALEFELPLLVVPPGPLLPVLPLPKLIVEAGLEEVDELAGLEVSELPANAPCIETLVVKGSG